MTTPQPTQEQKGEADRLLDDLLQTVDFEEDQVTTNTATRNILLTLISDRDRLARELEAAKEAKTDRDG